MRKLPIITAMLIETATASVRAATATPVREIDAATARAPIRPKRPIAAYRRRHLRGTAATVRMLTARARGTSSEKPTRTRKKPPSESGSEYLSEVARARTRAPARPKSRPIQTARPASRPARLSSSERRSVARARGVGGLERRRQRGGERRAEAQQAAFEERKRREREVAGGEREVEVADRLQHEPHESPAEHDADQQPERAADDAQHGGLGEDEGQDLAAPDAQGAQAPEELAALHDREGHRVVDQEGAAQQGEERQGAQIEPKRPRHLLERFGARGGARQMDARRQESRDLPAGRVRPPRPRAGRGRCG